MLRERARFVGVAYRAPSFCGQLLKVCSWSGLHACIESAHAAVRFEDKVMEKHPTCNTVGGGIRRAGWRQDECL